MQGVVSVGSDVAARAGAEMFARGGNAVDAAVAAVFAMTVADLANTSIGGRRHVLVSRPDGGVAALDGPDRIMDGSGCERNVAHLRGLGSTLTRADFADYRPLDGEVVRFNYRDWECCTIGRQGHGYALAATFGILDRFEVASMEPADRWITLALAQAIAHRGREKDESFPRDTCLSRERSMPQRTSCVRSDRRLTTT